MKQKEYNKALDKMTFIIKNKFQQKINFGPEINSLKYRDIYSLNKKHNLII